MTNTLILHLSDLHARQGETYNELARTVAGSCLPDLESIERVIVCFTGDLTFSGNSAETQVVLDFFTNLEHHLKNRFGVPPVILGIPGNHDCDFTNSSPNREILVEAARKPATELTADLTATCVEVQRSFFELIDCVRQGSRSASSVCWVEQINGTPALRFICVNTAWMSAIKEPHGQTRLPFSLLREALETDEDGITIFLAHHPPAWLQPEDGRKLTELLAAHVDIALFGHEHIAGEQSVGSLPAGTVSEVHFALALNDRHSDTEGFRSIVLSRNGKSVRTFTMTKKTDGTYRLDESKSSDWRPVKSKNKPKSDLPHLEPDQETWLKDIGLNLSHPFRPSGLTLSDLFIWPDLRRDDDQVRLGETNDTISSISILTGELPKLLLIIGDQLTGKTALAKQCVLELRKSRRFAVYSESKGYTHFNHKYLTDRIKLLIEKQYGKAGAGNYEKLPKLSRILIVDDLDALKGNSHAIKSLLTVASGIFSSIILLSTSDIEARAVVDPAFWTPIAESGEIFRLLPFGHALRYQLIEKWLRLGREHSISDFDLEKSTSLIKREIDTIVGRRTVPSLPAYILIVLQQMETMRQAGSALKDGSHGRLYESLIVRDLHRHLRDLDIDGTFNYLKYLSVKIADSEDNELAAEDAELFHTKYCEDYCIRVDFSSFIEQLQLSKVLERQQGNIKFKHPYIFYYFYGMYLSTILDNLSETKRVEKLFRSLHSEVSFNCVLFACFHDRECKILPLLVSKASSYFSDITEKTFTDFSAFLGESKAIEIRSILFDGARSDIRRHLYDPVIPESRVRAGISIAHDEELDKDIDEATIKLDRALELNGAIKCLQLIGQVLKNQAGRTTVELKKAALLELVSLLGRINGVILQSLRTAFPLMLELFSEGAPARGSEDKDEITDFAIDQFNRFVCRLGASLAAKSSSAIGSRHLLPAVKECFQSADVPNHAALVFGASSDCEVDFPMTLAIRGWERIEDYDIVLKYVFRALVLRRFYLFPEKEEVKQSICDRMSIERKHLLVRSLAEQSRAKRS